jgi:uncharacterized protein YjgD (DUF1641 family)/tetrahydromethanopterin S-methyltransferase subunit G
MERRMTTTTTISPASLEEINRKLDALTTQVEAIANEAAIQRQRRDAWVELLEDVRPITNQAFEMAVEQLDEVEEYVNLVDLGHLAKRLLRNTRNLEQLLDQMESLIELVGDAAPIGRSAFISLMEQLERFEQKGYFAFGKEAVGIVDQVVSSFTPEDVHALGDNVVLILNTVKEMTQPQVMTMMRRTASTVRAEEPPEDISFLGLLRQMRDPAVKRGLAKTLMALRSMSGEGPPETVDN